MRDPNNKTDPGARIIIVDGIELSLPPLPKKGAFEKAIEEARERDLRRSARDDGYTSVVTATAEWHRIRSIPRRVLDLKDVQDLTLVFRKPGGTMNLRPIQSASLYEAHVANGLFGPLPVGSGKTLLTLLLPEAMDSERAVLLIPTQLRNQLINEIEHVYSPHFNIELERIVQIVAYSELSLARNSTLLEELNPDLIIADECHALRRSSAARTKRFLRYMRENPQCRFVGLSGTITSNSILDYAHLIELALRKNSPLPDRYQELQDWAGVLDVKPKKRVQAGVLQQLCQGDENVRQGYRRRLVETLGVVAPEEGAIGTSLLVENIRPSVVPREIVESLNEVLNTWAFRGEEYSDPLAIWRFMRQMSCGFYYRWIWPDNEPDDEWLEARAAWKAAARSKIKLNRPGMDSELLVSNAAERWRKSVEDHSNCVGAWSVEDHSQCEYTTEIRNACGRCGDIPTPGCSQCEKNRERIMKNCIYGYSRKSKQCTGKSPTFEPVECKLYPQVKYCTGKKPTPTTKGVFQSEEWIAWCRVKGRYNPAPPTEAVWVSDWLAKDAVKRAHKLVKDGRKVILWYSHKVLGDRMEELSGFPHYGSGQDASGSTHSAMICSIATQGTGKNLQHYNHNIILSVPTNGKDFEQLVGRTHRPGQLADRVVVSYYDHTDALDDAMTSIINDALYTKDSMGLEQKILYADGEKIKLKKQSIEKIREERQRTTKKQ